MQKRTETSTKNKIGEQNKTNKIKGRKIHPITHGVDVAVYHPWLSKQKKINIDSSNKGYTMQFDFDYLNVQYES